MPPMSYLWRYLILGLFLGSSGLLAAPSPALAAGCYQPIYYQAMFNPVVQEAKDGDPRLIGGTDFVAAKGQDPHGGGQGCMCGINNGRWDQLLLNLSHKDMQRAPVSFSLLGLHMQFWEDGKAPKGKPVEIPAAKIAGCWNQGLDQGGHRSFKHPSGLSPSSQVLEPGENLFSCLCLGPDNREGAGFAWVTVTYQPAVFVRDLAPDLKAQGARQQAELEFKDLTPGQGRYLALIPPAGAKGLNLSLADAKGLDMYSASGWRDQMKAWKQGPLELASPDSGQPLWILVRAQASGGSGRLKVSYEGPAPAAGEAGWRLRPQGQPGQRSFKAYMLCGFERKKGDPAGAKGIPFNWKDCCNSPNP